MLYFYLRPHVRSGTVEENQGGLNRGLTFPAHRRHHYLLRPLGAIIPLNPGATDIVHGRNFRCVITGDFKQAVLGKAKYYLELNAGEREALELALLALLEDLDDD